MIIDKALGLSDFKVELYKVDLFKFSYIFLKFQNF